MICWVAEVHLLAWEDIVIGSRGAGLGVEVKACRHSCRAKKLSSWCTTLAVKSVGNMLSGEVCIECRVWRLQEMVTELATAQEGQADAMW